VRGALGLGYRRQLKSGWRTPVFTDRVDPQKPDNMFSIALLAEPKYLYFSERNSDPRFVVPQDTFELDGKLALRWDALERNLLELAHSGYALGFDASYGWRANWEDWGINRSERAERGRYPKLFQTYAVAATGVRGWASAIAGSSSCTRAGAGTSTASRSRAWAAGRADRSSSRSRGPRFRARTSASSRPGIMRSPCRSTGTSCSSSRI
jgi:hypothetical protein